MLPETMRAFEYRHVVGFEDTNLVGNVYYTNHFKWQGRCRELFLKEHVPELLDRFEQGFALVTVRCSCEYLAELAAFDEVGVRMRLKALLPSRIGLQFEYWRCTTAGEELVATGEQEVACMRREGSQLMPAPVPVELRQALQEYAGART